MVNAAWSSSAGHAHRKNHSDKHASLPVRHSTACSGPVGWQPAATMSDQMQSAFSQAPPSAAARMAAV